MGRFIRGKRGFTLIELLIVIAIMGVLAGVILPNIVGLLGKGGLQAYETDHEVISIAAASSYYLDTHAGLVYDPNQDGNPEDTMWGCNCTAEHYQGPPLTHNPDHYYPTSIAYSGNHTLYLSDTMDPDNPDYEAFLIIGGSGLPGCANCASYDDISKHAIWMGLLINEGGAYDSADDDGNCDGPKSQCGTTDRLYVSALTRESGLYLQEMPESAMRGDEWNGAEPPGGNYCWIVGKNGNVYGAYRGGEGGWYAGFSGAYP
ncbi:MAG TPA: type II secretion system protein [Dehalococcoidia bacterium]|nr:type II secretion system protein [Dehalococcoidia bacterium]